jgi:hypothetical protein
MNLYERECRHFADERKPAGCFLASGGSVKKTTIGTTVDGFCLDQRNFGFYSATTTCVNRQGRGRGHGR